jgi:hypothetical protein
MLVRMLNLKDAIDAWTANPTRDREWRTHLQLPVFLDDLGAFGTTRDGIEAAMSVHGDTPLSDYPEIETYTWDVLPVHQKTRDIVEYVVRELTWVRDMLQALARPAQTPGACQATAG